MPALGIPAGSWDLQLRRQDGAERRFDVGDHVSILKAIQEFVLVCGRKDFERQNIEILMNLAGASVTRMWPEMT